MADISNEEKIAKLEVEYKNLNKILFNTINVMNNKLDVMTDKQTDIIKFSARIEGKIDNQNNRIEKLELSREKMVYKSEFTPIKNLIFGAVGIILIAVLYAIIAMVGL